MSEFIFIICAYRTHYTQFGATNGEQSIYVHSTHSNLDKSVQRTHLSNIISAIMNETNNKKGKD